LGLASVGAAFGLGSFIGSIWAGFPVVGAAEGAVGFGEDGAAIAPSTQQNTPTMLLIPTSDRR
jgi:hypothetical protein